MPPGFKHQGTTAEKTTLQKLNQGKRKKRAVYRFFLDFLVLLCQVAVAQLTYADNFI